MYLSTMDAAEYRSVDSRHPLVLVDRSSDLLHIWLSNFVDLPCIVNPGLSREFFEDALVQIIVPLLNTTLRCRAGSKRHIKDGFLKGSRRCCRLRAYGCNYVGHATSYLHVRHVIDNPSTKSMVDVISRLFESTRVT